MKDNHIFASFIRYSIFISTYRLLFSPIDAMLMSIWPLCKLCKHCVFGSYHCLVIKWKKKDLKLDALYALLCKKIYDEF